MPRIPVRNRVFIKHVPFVFSNTLAKGKSHVIQCRWIVNRYESVSVRNRSALAITDTELNVIAALAIIGLSRSPNIG